MTRRELSRYHDLATTSKRRGRGIGFAGVGIKLALLACSEVVTETRRGRQHASTSWRLAHRTRAPWSWIQPLHLLEDDGTAVLLRLSNPLSQLLDAGFIETTALRHFQPLFEPEFLDILGAAYPAGFTVRIRGRVVVGPIRPAERYPIAIRIGRQRKPSGVGYLARHDEPLPEHERGLAISTLGKVIRRGWDWLGLTPPQPDRIEGLIEVPALAEALTLNKGDFLRHGARGALFVSYRKAIQEAVSAQLAVWGAEAPPRRRAPRTRPMERDIRKVLGDMAAEYPILTSLVDRHQGGQRRLPFGDSRGSVGSGVWSGGEPLATAPGAGPAGNALAPDARDDAATGTGTPTRQDDTSHDPVSPPMPPAGEGAASVSGRTGAARMPARAGRKRPTTLSLEIRFESRPDELSLGRLIESTVWINDLHPAYLRAVASRAEGYHIALAVAAALAPLTVEPALAQDFVNTFLARWGEAAVDDGTRRGK